MTKNTRLSLFGLILVLLIAWYAKPIIWSASSSYNKVSVFNADERDQLKWVKTAYEEGNYDFPLNKYGHLYFDIVLTGLNITSWFTEITDQHIIIYLRLVSAVFGMLSVLMLYVLVRRFLDDQTAWLAAVMLLAIPLNFWDLSFQAHPDIAQVFFIIVAIYWCSYITLSSKNRSYYLAMFFAGLTFSVKYSGLFLIPVIFLVQILHKCSIYQVIPGRFNSSAFINKLRVAATGMVALAFLMYFFITPENVANVFLDSPIESKRNLNFIEQIQYLGLLLGVAGSVLVLFQPFWNYLKANTPLAYNTRSLLAEFSLGLTIFAAIFAITSPYLLVDFEFLRGLLQQSEIVSSGHVYVQEPGFWGWFNVLHNPVMFDKATLSFGLIGLLVAFATFGTYGIKNRRSLLWISAIWSILYFLLLVIRIGHHPPRFLLPIVPFLIILSSYSIISLFRKILDYVAPRNRASIEGILTAAIVLTVFAVNVPQLYEFRTQMAEREENNAYLQAGEFLAENYDPGVRIVHDAYSYIPQSFENEVEVWNLTLDKVEAENPELVIVNDHMSSRFPNKSRASKFAGGEETYMESYNFYRLIRQDSLSYRLVKDFGPVQIYEKAVADSNTDR